MIVETDCLSLVHAGRNDTPDASQVGLILQDCKEILSGLTDCSLVHVKRTANMVLQKLHLLHPVVESGVYIHVPHFLLEMYSKDFY